MKRPVLLLLLLMAVFAVRASTNTPAFSSHETGNTINVFPPDSLDFDTLVTHDNFLLSPAFKKYYVVEDSAKYTYSMVQEDLFFFMKQWPKVVHRVNIGMSEFSLDMTAVRVGTGKPKSNCVFLVGNVHAREDFSSKLIMKFLNIYLLSIDGKSKMYPQAKQWLDSIDIYVLPVANPDGLKIAHEDFEGIESQFLDIYESILVVETFKEWKANGRGIDINMTFDDGNFYLKRGPVFQTNPASEGHKGMYPAQPVETQNIQRFIAERKPLITASFHTKGNIMFWADTSTHGIYKGLDTKMVQRLSDASGFRISGIATDPSDYGCGLENYVRSRYGLMGICIELSNAGGGARQQHPDEKFNQLVWNRAWNMPFILIETAVRNTPEIRKNSKEYLHRR